MPRFVLFLFAFAIGFVAAIPVGGCQIEMAKRVLQGRLVPGLMVVAGSATSDVFYGAIALFGIAPFMAIPWVLALFMAFGAILLWVLAFVTLKQGAAPLRISEHVQQTKGKRRGFVTGFVLGFSNPPIMMSWLLGVTLAQHLGLTEPFDAAAKGVFITGGALGLGSYLGGLALVLHRVKHAFSLASLGRVYRWLGVSLILLSFFFVYGVVKFFVN